MVMQGVAGGVRGVDGDAGEVIIVSHGYENIYERGFCNGLHDAGVDFTLISSDQTDYLGLRAGIRTLNLRGSQSRSRSSWRKLLNIARYHAVLMLHVALKRPAVLHVIGLIEPPLLCGIIEGLWFRFWAKKYVLTIHDIERHDTSTELSRRLYGVSFRVASTLVAHTDRVLGELVAHHGIAAERIVVMQHGLEPLAELRELPPLGHKPQPLRLLFFGKVMRYKGVDLLLKALEEFSLPVSLTIAGRSVNECLTEELNAQIEAHPRRQAIQWRNVYVPESQIAELFLRADALVLPYRRIDQSGVLFQALRFGCPVVVARVGSLACYIDETMGESCEPEDASSLRAAIQRLAERYSATIDRPNMRAAGRRYEWHRVVTVLLSVYRDPQARYQ
jgi:glycosyltransferase involved in cell wall biosynthesis